MKNEIDKTVEHILGLEDLADEENDFMKWSAFRPSHLKALANAYTQLKADLATALNEADALRAEVEEMNELFQAQWEADMRAVKLWQDATPGKEFTLPDRTNHVVWLLNRIEFDEKIYAEMREENERLKSELAAIKPNAAAGQRNGMAR